MQQNDTEKTLFVFELERVAFLMLHGVPYTCRSFWASEHEPGSRVEIGFLFEKTDQVLQLMDSFDRNDYVPVKDLFQAWKRTKDVAMSKVRAVRYGFIESRPREAGHAVRK